VDFSDYLVSSQLLNCSGKVTHTLTLLPDGNVEVAMSAVTVVVDPVAKVVVRPPGVRVDRQVFEKAGVLAQETFG